MAAAVESPEFRFRRIVETDSSPSSAESRFRELDDAFLQTQTRIWLGEVLQTRFAEQTSISDLLADGQLLFQVSEVIQRMLITTSMDISHLKRLAWQSLPSSKSTGRYMPYFNVASFLRVCQILGLAGIDLFTPSDVVEKRNTRKVCMCIRLFSKKARSKKLNVPDFDVVASSVSMPTDMVECMRRSLELSQCSSSLSLSPDAGKGSRRGRRQRESGVDFDGDVVYFSDGYDNGENTCLQVESARRLYPADSHITASLMIPDSGVNGDSSFTQVGGLPSHIIKGIEDVVEGGRYTPKSVTESVGSPCSHTYFNQHCDCMPFLSWLGSHASDEVLEGNIISAQDSESGVRSRILPFLLDSYQESSSQVGDYICGHIDDSGTCCSSCMSSNLTLPSHGMRRFTSGSYDSIEDADCMSSTSDREVSSHLHHNCVEEDRFMVADVQSYPLQYDNVANHRFRSLMDELESFPSSAVELLDHCVGNESSSCASSIARKESCGNLDASSSNKTTVTKSIKCLDHGAGEDISKGFKLQNISDGDRDGCSRVQPCMVCEHKLATSVSGPHCAEPEEAAQQWEEDDRIKVTPKQRSSRMLVVKSVVSGTALAGVLLFLLHIRRKRWEEAGKASKLTANATKYSSHKAAKQVISGSTGNSVYPAEKLHFGMK
ncbi:hypothetical protein Dimus_021845 [Dionaea muscipula]